MTTYADTYAALNRAVQTRAVSVVIDTDMGEVTLTPAEALAAFDDIAPGEGFTLVSVTERDLPAGITGFDPIEVGERRWNGAVWSAAQVERYNAELKRIETRAEVVERAALAFATFANIISPSTGQVSVNDDVREAVRVVLDAVEQFAPLPPIV